MAGLGELAESYRHTESLRDGCNECLEKPNELQDCCIETAHAFATTPCIGCNWGPGRPFLCAQSVARAVALAGGESSCVVSPRPLPARVRAGDGMPRFSVRRSKSTVRQALSAIHGGAVFRVDPLHKIAPRRVRILKNLNRHTHGNCTQGFGHPPQGSRSPACVRFRFLEATEAERGTGCRDRFHFGAAH